MNDLRQAIFSAVMQFLYLHEDDTDDQLYATEFTDAILRAVADVNKDSAPETSNSVNDPNAQSVVGWMQ